MSVAIGIALLALAACGDAPPAPAPEVGAPAAGAAEPTATPVPIPTIEPVTRLLFTGDIIPARCTYAAVVARGGDWTLPFQALHDTLTAADITIGTLDATASDAAIPYGCVETFSLAAPAAAVEGLRYAGYDVISHAANHIKDCGAVECNGDEVMLDTHAELRAAGIQPVGAGANIAQARAPVLVERHGVRFAFLAYDDIATYYHANDVTAGAAPLDAETIAADVAGARLVADVVIVLPQWGIEYTTEPSERQREFARAARRAGADIVAGNHPHWPQAYERIDGMFVAYALGNFVFDQDWSLETQQGVLLEATFTGATLTAIRFIPIHIYDQYQPRLAPPPEARSILDRIDAASAALLTVP